MRQGLLGVTWGLLWPCYDAGPAACDADRVTRGLLSVMLCTRYDAERAAVCICVGLLEGQRCCVHAASRHGAGPAR